VGQQNYILDYFGFGKNVLILHDDIKNFYKLNGKDLKLIYTEQCADEFEKCFDICEKNNIYLWGMYMIKNPYFMKKKINNKGFIISSVMGLRINSLRFDEDLSVKEDYDYTLQNIITHKKVARFDYLCNDAGHMQKTGGGYDYIYKDNKKDEYAKYTHYI